MTQTKLHWEEVRESPAVNFLTGASQRYFQPFLSRECSVAQAAQELQVAPNKLLYHVQKALQLGLLKVVKVQRRPGKPIKTYRSSADIYFIPFEATPAETLESWLLPLEDEWHARWVQHAAQTMRHSEIPFGLRLWREENGSVIVKPTPAPPTPIDDALLDSIPVLALWTEVALTPAESRELNQELLNLYERYARKSGQSGGTRHLLHLALTPMLGGGHG